jgi:hypothetical protein
MSRCVSRDFDVVKEMLSKINYNFKILTELTALELRCLTNFFNSPLELTFGAMSNASLNSGSLPMHL